MNVSFDVHTCISIKNTINDEWYTEGKEREYQNCQFMVDNAECKKTELVMVLTLFG